MKSENKEGLDQVSAEDDVRVVAESKPQMLLALDLVNPVLGLVNPGGGRRYSRAESSTVAHEVSFLMFDPGALLIRWEAGTNSGTSGERVLENPEEDGDEAVRSSSLGRA